MSPIFTQPCAPAHVHPDDAARKRQERLARATAEQAETALAYLSAIGPLLFEIAIDAADLIVGMAPQDEAAGTMRLSWYAAGAAARPRFPDHGLKWQLFRRDWTTSGPQEVYDPGHPAEVIWRLPGEGPEQP